MAVHRGEIYYADLSPVVGSEQGGVRPVLIVQNEVGNRFSPTVIAAAITSQQEKADLPTHIHVQADRNGLQRRNLMIRKSHKLLDQYINSRIIYNMLDEEAWNEYLNQDDDNIRAALNVFAQGKAFPKKPAVKKKAVRKVAVKKAVAKHRK